MQTFTLNVQWQGSTADRGYSRDAVANPPGKPPIPLSTAPEYGGDPAAWNPDELFGAALSNCHMQTFLSLAAKVGIDVRSYNDHVEVVLDTIDRVTKVTEIRLRPTIEICGDCDPVKTRKFFEKAHKYCFIANSITAKVVMEPTIQVTDQAA